MFSRMLQSKTFSCGSYFMRSQLQYGIRRGHIDTSVTVSVTLLYFNAMNTGIQEAKQVYINP